MPNVLNNLQLDGTCSYYDVDAYHASVFIGQKAADFNQAQGADDLGVKADL